jgi:hypothetical protein
MRKRKDPESGSIPLTNGSGSGRGKNMRIRIRIGNRVPNTWLDKRQHVAELEEDADDLTRIVAQLLHRLGKLFTKT